MPESGTITDYFFEGYRLEVHSKTLFDPQGNPVPLSHRALDTLILLVRNKGKTLSKAYLIEHVWPGVYVEENNLNQAITSIRKALGDSKQSGQFIKTFKGKGYCFIAELKQLDSNAQRASGIQGNPSAGTLAEITYRLKALVREPVFSVLVVSALVVAVLTGLFESAGQSGTDTNSSLAIDLDTGSGLQSAIPGSIAVLPLTTLNPDVENKVLALGMHMELINRLSRVDTLKLISHNGVAAQSVQEQPLTELGKMLNVEYLVTGSILLLDDNARINLYLLDADTGVILWTDNYEVETNSLTGSMPSRIALDIASAMDVTVSANNRLQVQEQATSSFESYRYHLAAVSAFQAMDFAKTWSLTEQALDLDPNYLDAVQMFSRVNSVLAAMPMPGMTSTDHIRLSLEAAQHSIQLDPDDQRGYMLKTVALGSGKQWHEAMAELENLRAMNASLSSLQFLAPILMSLGHFDETVEILEANLKEEPINLYARGFLLAALEMSGQRMKSRLEYDLGEELNPEWWGDTVNVFLAMGRHEPILDINKLTDISDDIKQMLAYINADDMATLRTALADFDPGQLKDTVGMIYVGSIAAYSGNHDLALELLSLAVAEVGINIHWVWLPVFDETRKREGFKTLVSEAGLVDYWQVNGWPPYCRPVDDSFRCDIGAYDMVTMQ